MGSKRTVRIAFNYVKARGLIVRASKREIDPLRYQGQEFSQIVPDGEHKLSYQSKSFPGGTAGLTTVPIKVYASTQVQEDRADSKTGAEVEGKFTISNELNNEVIVVKALGDYDADGVADVVIAEAEGRMSNGIANIPLEMNRGLPDDEDNLHDKFNKKIYDGLGVAFIAYVKNDLTISNRGYLKRSDLSDPTEFKISGDHNATDTVVIKSDIASNIKVGDFNNTVKFLKKQWDKDFLQYYILDDADTATEQDIYFTAVDKFDNPAKVGTTSRLSCDYPSATATKKVFSISRCRSSFGTLTNGWSRHKITVKPTDNELNSFVGEDKDVNEKLHILGSGGLASAEPIDIMLYMARITKNYVIQSDFSNKIDISNITLSGRPDRDFKVVVQQLESDSTNAIVKVYERRLDGTYDSNDKSSTYEPHFGGTEIKKSNGADMRSGGTIRIDDVGSIVVPAYTKSDTFPLDGFIAYFFRIQNKIDTKVVIIPSDTSSAENGSSDSQVEPGSAITFYFYGQSAQQDDNVELVYGQTQSHIGLANAPAITKQSTLWQNSVRGLLDHREAISIKGYTVTSSSRDFEIFLNGRAIHEDQVVSRNSDLKIDDGEKDGLYPDIEFQYNSKDDDRNTEQINIKEFGRDNSASGYGTSEKSLLPLNDINGDGIKDDSSLFEETEEEIIYRGKVYANKYYLLFDEDSDLEEWDAFGNILKTKKGARRDLEDYDFDVTGRGESKVREGKAYVKFDNYDAGKEREVQIEARDGVNKIIFTNIVASSLANDTYIIEPEKTTPQINLVNAEVVIKVMGNNRGKSDDFSLSFEHQDKSAKIHIIKIEAKREDLVSKIGGGSISEPLKESGNHYIIRTDKPGIVTIKGKGVEKDEKIARSRCQDKKSCGSLPLIEPPLRRRSKSMAMMFW